MRTVIVPVIITIIYMVADILLARFKSLWKYIIIFLFICGLEFFFSVSICQANIPKYECLTQVQRTDYERKVKYHLLKANYCFNQAYEESMFIPNLDSKTIARHLFESCLWSIGTGTLRGAAIASLGVSLYNYGMFMYDQWELIDTLLLESKYHYEMMDFYNNVLRKG